MSQFLARWSAHKGEVIPVSHDFSNYIAQYSTTLSSAVTQNEGLTLQNKALDNNLWSAQLVCEKEGNYTYELKATYADGTIEVLEFAVDVFDAAPNNQATPGYGGRFRA